MTQPARERAGKTDSDRETVIGGGRAFRKGTITALQRSRLNLSIATEGCRNQRALNKQEEEEGGTREESRADLGEEIDLRPTKADPIPVKIHRFNASKVGRKGNPGKGPGEPLTRSRNRNEPSCEKNGEVTASAMPHTKKKGRKSKEAEKNEPEETRKIARPTPR